MTHGTMNITCSSRVKILAVQHSLCVEEEQGQKLHGIYNIMQLTITLMVACVIIQEILKSIRDQNIRLQFQTLDCGLPIPAVTIILQFQLLMQ
jgi:hypothetical protein